MADDAAFESLQHRHVMSGYWSSADDAWMDVPAKAQSELSLGTSCIPRHNHLVWLGGSLPAMLRRVASSWQAAHPQWQVTLWDDEAVKELPLFNQAAFDTAPNRGFQADVLRYELLYRFGGFYADVDLLCLRSVAPLAALSSFVTAQSHSTVWELNNAFIGAAPGHPVLALTMLAIRHAAVAAAVAPPGLASDLSAAAATQFQARAQDKHTAPSAAVHPYGGMPAAGGVQHPYGRGLVTPPQHPYATPPFAHSGTHSTHPYAATHPPGPSPAQGGTGGGSASDPMVTVSRTGPGVFTRATMAYAAAVLHAASDSGLEAADDAPHVARLTSAVLPEPPSTSGWGVAHAATAAVLASITDSDLLQQLADDWDLWLGASWPDMQPSAAALAPHLRWQPLPLVLPAKTVYPIPNTNPVGPPAVFRSDESCSDALRQLRSFTEGQQGVLSAGATVQASVLAAAPALPKPLAQLLVGKQQRYRIQQPGVFTVHWWAQAWKRPQAQLKEAKAAKHHGSDTTPKQDADAKQ